MSCTAGSMHRSYLPYLLWLLATVTLAVAESSVEDPPLIHIAAEVGIERSRIINEIARVVSERAAVHIVKKKYGKKCFVEDLKSMRDTQGLIFISEDGVCKKPETDAKTLVLRFISGQNNTLRAESGAVIKDLSSGLSIFFTRMIKKIEEAKAEENDGYHVPFWVFVLIGLIGGLLIAGNLYLINKMRKLAKKEKESGNKKETKISISDQQSSGKREKCSSRKSNRCSSSKSSRCSRSRSSRRESEKKSKRTNENSSIYELSSVQVVPVLMAIKECGDSKAHDEKDEVIDVMRRKNLYLRPLPMRIDRPMTEEEFIGAMKNVIEFAVEYYRNPGKNKVVTDYKPTFLFNAIGKEAPEDPESFLDVWKTFNQLIFPGLVHWQHPQFHAFFPNGRSYPDILAETTIASLGTVGFSWGANPAITEMDAAMVNWTGRAFGIPERFLFSGSNPRESPGGGWVAETASDTIFCAVIAARHVMVEKEIAKRGVGIEQLEEKNNHAAKRYDERAGIIAKLVAYGSYESHSSFEKACTMAYVRCRPIKVYEKDKFGMRLEHLEKAIKRDIARGLIPFYVHIALGTTSTATSDHIEELVKIKEKYDVWVHVDAAYAGSAWVEPKYRLNKGIEKADSININLHKFFLTSTSLALFWTARQFEYTSCFAFNSSANYAYLKNKGVGSNELRDWGVPFSRRFRSLKVYMLLRMYGIKGMRAYINRIIDMTAYMEKEMLKIPFIKKYGDLNYGLFCVQYVEPGVDVNAATTKLCEDLNATKRIVFTHSKVDHHSKPPRHDDIIRVGVTLERATTKDVDDSMVIFKEVLAEFQKRKAADPNYLLTNSKKPIGFAIGQDPGISGTPCPTTVTSRTPIVPSSDSSESLDGKPRPSISNLSMDSTQRTVTAAPAADTVAAPVAAAAAQPAAHHMPPLQPTLLHKDSNNNAESSSKSGTTASYNAPAAPAAAPAAAPTASAAPAPAQVPITSAPETIANSQSEKKAI